MQSPLISTQELAEQLNDSNVVIVDVRWAHAIPNFGYEAYLREHIPNAVFLDLESDLSDVSDKTKGRHPLSTPEHFIKALARVGIGKGKRIVAYDENGGSLAARLWWMMKWLELDNAQLLDGGIVKWIAEQRAVESGAMTKEISPVIPFEAKANYDLVAEIEMVETAPQNNFVLLDARTMDRFNGIGEGIDSRGGHIPNAIDSFWGNNLTQEINPVFRTAEELKNHFAKLGISENTPVVAYCGSGVTACHNIIALEMAGVKNIKLYPGSWSEWIEMHNE